MLVKGTMYTTHMASPHTTANALLKGLSWLYHIHVIHLSIFFKVVSLVLDQPQDVYNIFLINNYIVGLHTKVLTKSVAMIKFPVTNGCVAGDFKIFVAKLLFS